MILVVPHTRGDVTQVEPFTIGVLTLVVPQTNGDVTHVLPFTIGVLTLVVPQTNGDSKLVLPHKVVPVKLPFNVTLSLKVISQPPVRELKASAQTVPDALILPDTVRASVGLVTPIPTPRLPEPMRIFSSPDV